MEFIGREQELESMKRMLSSEGPNVTLVLGRRRVGKSALIVESLSRCDAVSVYYECKRTTEANNAESLSEVVSEALGIPGLTFGSIEDAVEFLYRSSKERKAVLVLDEYPYLRDVSPGLDSVLQRLVDAHTLDSSLSLVLCGSFVDVMRSLLGAGNPLYGRVDLTIELGPMDYLDAARFYPAFSCADKVRLYSVFGGIPYYTRLIDPSLSVTGNIMELVTCPGARLENEVEMHLGSEIAKMENANEVFGALAAGYTKYSDIRDQSHVSSGPTLVDTLGKLIKMGLVEKTAPINCADNRRRRGYRIVDGLTLFQYRYVFRYSSQRSIMAPQAFWERFVADDFDHRFVPLTFEDICRQYLTRRNLAGGIDPPLELIGSYSYNDPVAHTNGEFDVVAQDAQGYAFYEAKFRSTPITRAMVEEEIAQVEATGLACHRYGFFSCSGFEPDAAQGAHGRNVELVSIEELYA